MFNKFQTAASGAVNCRGVQTGYNLCEDRCYRDIFLRHFKLQNRIVDNSRNIIIACLTDDGTIFDIITVIWLKFYLYGVSRGIGNRIVKPLAVAARDTCESDCPIVCSGEGNGMPISVSHVDNHCLVRHFKSITFGGWSGAQIFICYVRYADIAPGCCGSSYRVYQFPLIRANIQLDRVASVEFSADHTIAACKQRFTFLAGCKVYCVGFISAVRSPKCGGHSGILIRNREVKIVISVFISLQVRQ